MPIFPNSAVKKKTEKKEPGGEEPDEGQLRSRGAVDSLGMFGFQARGALGTLLPILEEDSAYSELYQHTAKAFEAIASSLDGRVKELEDFELIGLLLQMERGTRALKNARSSDFNSAIENLEKTNRSLEAGMRDRPLMYLVYVFILWLTSRFVWSVVGFVYAGLALLWTVLAAFWPASLAAFFDWLSVSEISGPISLVQFGRVRIGRFLAHLLLVSIFCRIPRVARYLKSKPPKEKKTSKQNKTKQNLQTP